MKGLETLISVQKRNLDEMRRNLVNLENQKEQLIQLAARLHKELISEREAAIRQPQMGPYMAEFEKRTNKRQVEIAKEVVRLDQDIFQVTAAIAEHFGELKKYEIAHERQLETEKQQADKREQQALDEASRNLMGRKKNNGDFS